MKVVRRTDVFDVNELAKKVSRRFGKWLHKSVMVGLCVLTAL